MSSVGKFIQVYVRHKTNRSENNKIVLGNMNIFPYDYISKCDLTESDEIYPLDT
ncbi:MAG: hypothetical protein IKF11_03720 [Methanobrevibacter sp.]|nr:hypothetical protein [Methanobrevibacter sp.]